MMCHHRAERRREKARSELGGKKQSSDEWNGSMRNCHQSREQQHATAHDAPMTYHVLSVKPMSANVSLAHQMSGRIST